MTTDPQYSRDDVEMLSETTSYANFFELMALKLKFRYFDGQMSDPVTRELLKQGESVGVLIHDPTREEILLVEQFRVGALEDEQSPWLYELVAGRLDQSRTLEQVAAQESQEEANVIIENLQKMYAYWVSPGGTDEKFTLFYAQADLSQAGGVHGLASEAEDIKTHIVKTTEIAGLLKKGLIKNSMTLIGLQWFLLNV